MLEMAHIYKTYGKKGAKKLVLKDVGLKLMQGKTLGIMGKSGSGKSTIARILLMLEPADSGKILYNGKEVVPKDRKSRKLFRREVQYISQHPESFFDPSWKLGKSILEVSKIHRLKEDPQKKLMEYLKQVKLNASVLERYPYQVSGGEIQRLAFCRAMLLDPKVLILDEVTSMLDVSVQAQIMMILKQLQAKTGMAYLMVSHDYEVLHWFTDQIKELKEGRLHNLQSDIRQLK